MGGPCPDSLRLKPDFHPFPRRDRALEFCIGSLGLWTAPLTISSMVRPITPMVSLEISKTFRSNLRAGITLLATGFVYMILIIANHSTHSLPPTHTHANKEKTNCWAKYKFVIQQTSMMNNKGL